MRRMLAVATLSGLLVAGGCSTPPEAAQQDESHQTGAEEVQQDQEAVDAVWATFEEEFNQIRTDAPPLGEGDDEQTIDRLQYLMVRDQFWREKLHQLAKLDVDTVERQALMERLAERMHDVDAENTAELQDYLDDHPWPCKQQLGEQADQAAWMIVQHADHDPGFQTEVLEMLEELVDEERTAPERYAMLYDRVAVAEDRPQRYGSQGQCKPDGTWEMFEVEDPEGLDERRTRKGLEPMELHRPVVEELCEPEPSAGDD